MVATVTSFGRSGLHDWFVQRLSAVVMALFAIYTVYFVATTPQLGYEQWVGFFSSMIVKAFATVTLLLLSLHIWVGMWIVATDYIKPTGIRMIFQAALIIYCLVIIFWGFQILWSV